MYRTVALVFGINVVFHFTIGFVPAFGIAITIGIVFIVSIVISARVVMILAVTAKAYLVESGQVP